MSSNSPCRRSQRICPHGAPPDQVEIGPDERPEETAQQQLTEEVGAQVRTVVDRLFWEMFHTHEGNEHE